MHVSVRDLLLGGLILTLALVFRLWAGYTTFTPDFDTGTVCLMAQHILDGQRPLFFYGQNYMGALEAYVAAGFCKLFGYSHFSVSLSPIFFSMVWVWFSALLFGRWVGKKAFYVVLLGLAFPSWYLLRYTVSPFGGYPATLTFGVMSLYFALRWTESERLREGFFWAGLLGVVAALGLWTHMLVVPFFITAGLMILQRLRHLGGYAWLSLLPGALLSVLGFLPYGRVGGVYTTTKTTKMHWGDGDHWKDSLEMLFEVNWPMLAGWGYNNEFAQTWPSFCAIGLAVMGFGFAVWGIRKASVRMRWVLFSFSLIFLMLFLPHSMAVLRAPRYILSIYCLLSMGVWVTAICYVPRSGQKWGLAIFALWILFQLGSGIQYIQLESRKAELTNRGAEAFIGIAKEVGADAVGLLGGVKFRLEGQRLSADAMENTAFFNVEDERYLPYADRFDGAENYAYGLRSHHGGRMRESLEALSCSWESAMAESFLLVYDFKPQRVYPEVGWSWVSGSRVEGMPSLTDGTLKGLDFMGGQELVIDAGRLVNLDRLWLTETKNRKDRLPLSYEIALSKDGVHYTSQKRVRNRLPMAEVMDDRVFVGHHYGRLEHRFAGQEARYVRLSLGESASGKITLGELALFEEVDPWPVAEEVAMIEFLKAQRNLKYFCNVFMSAKLGPLGLSVMPRYNPRFTETSRRPSLLASRSDKGLVVERALAEHSEQMLRDSGYGYERSDFGSYSVIILKMREPMSDLVWSGRQLLRP